MNPKPLILVVDDSPVNLKLATKLLEWEGYRVQQAADAEMALAIVRDTPPDLILLDLQLPRMDGLTFARLLKDDPATRAIRIAAFTAHVMKGDEEKALSAGCDGYISKPIDTREFPRQVAECLNKQI